MDDGAAAEQSFAEKTATALIAVKADRYGPDIFM
jgi:hypothetical protein